MADYYDDEGGGEADKPTPEKDSDGATALLPKSFFGGKELEVGKPCPGKIVPVRILEDEVEVRYTHAKEPDEEKAEPEPAMASEAEDENYM